MLEIERKFLVKGEFKSLSYANDKIIQAYISNKPVVRIRQKGDKAFLTIKGTASADGLSRFEWEKEITLSDLEALLTLCDPANLIEKRRYYVNHNGFIYEVDVFCGRNEGLVVAELELPTIDAPYEKPGWLGEEVTGDHKYSNSQLAKYPYTGWQL